MQYNFLNDSFTTFENVETPKVTLDMPLMDSPLDISDWSTRVTSEGTPIVKDNVKSKMTINNSEEVEVRPASETSGSSQPDNTKFKSKDEWANKLAEAYRKLGVSENGIRNLIAKNALETNWGKAAQGRYNYGNITVGSSWKGDYVNGRDHDSKGNPIRNKFRSYNSIEEFARDEVAFLKRLYDFNDQDDIDTFTYKLQGGNKGKRKYAGDPKYRSSVKKIYGQV